MKYICKNEYNKYNSGCNRRHSINDILMSSKK